MAKHRQLTPAEAKRTIAASLGSVLDDARQAIVDAGLRPYNVDLVWTRWSGGQRGVGVETEAARVPVAPSPIVDLSGIEFDLRSAGYKETGTTRVQKVSVTFTADELNGLISERLCQLHDLTEVPQPYEFYYEIREDGRGDTKPVRQRFRIAGTPNLQPFGWSVSLERVDVDPKRNGKPIQEPALRKKPVEGFDSEEDA